MKDPRELAKEARSREYRDPFIVSLIDALAAALDERDARDKRIDELEQRASDWLNRANENWDKQKAELARLQTENERLRAVVVPVSKLNGADIQVEGAMNKIMRLRDKALAALKPS